MASKNYRCAILSSFNAENLSGLLENDEGLPKIFVKPTPFGQVIPPLIDTASGLWDDIDFAVVWTQPSSVIKSFQNVLQYQASSMQTLLQEVDNYCSLLDNFQKIVKTIFVPTWTCPASLKPFSMLDVKNGVGIANVLMRMNLRLAENLEVSNHVYLLNTQNWLEAAGKNSFNAKLWYTAKIAFGNEVFKEAVKDIKSALRGIHGESRKLIILDLDNTLWGGIVGDLGWEKLDLGGHSPDGEAFIDFQKALKTLKNRGILLGISSKNQEEVALEAINSHPEMILHQDDFSGWRINWGDKAQNIVDLVAQLNLGLESVVFIDDNPVERARVSKALPEVLVPKWPADKMLYETTLLNLRCFNSPFLSDEDVRRTEMYLSESKRNQLKDQVSSLDDWLNSLNIYLKPELLNSSNLKRACQLLNKTNQMNLSTRRLSESELLDWLKKGNRTFWIFRVSDKFGDSGLTGLASLEIDGKVGRICDFVLSCRTMGRRIEEAILHTVVQYAKKNHLERISACYLPTPKNKPCLDFLNNSGLKREGDNFFYNCDKTYSAPQCIHIESVVK